MNAQNGNNGGPPKVLLVGYNGANNTGAEALLLADIEDVRAVLGRRCRDHHPHAQPGEPAALCQGDAELAHRSHPDHLLPWPSAAWCARTT